VRSKEARVQTNAGNPFGDHPGVLPRRYRHVPTSTAAKEVLAWFLIGGSDIIIDRLAGLLCHLEPDRLAGLPLAHGCPIDRMTMRSNVLDPQADNVASSELAIDGQIEHREVACAPSDLQLGTDRPDVLRPERRLGADQFTFVPGLTT
jgi:hypothetical protein